MIETAYLNGTVGRITRSRDRRVVVIGSGFSGLASAVRLQAMR